MKEGNAKQGQGKEDEIDRYTADCWQSQTIGSQGIQGKEDKTKGAQRQ